jgi:hypothetical protein
MRWLAECSAEALGDALRAVAPELSRLPFTVPEPVTAIKADPQYWTSSAVLGERFIAKFAWSRPAAIRLAHEIGTLTALGSIGLGCEPSVPFLAPVPAASQQLPSHLPHQAASHYPWQL